MKCLALLDSKNSPLVITIVHIKRKPYWLISLKAYVLGGFFPVAYVSDWSWVGKSDPLVTVSMITEWVCQY